MEEGRKVGVRKEQYKVTLTADRRKDEMRKQIKREQDAVKTEALQKLRLKISTPEKAKTEGGSPRTMDISPIRNLNFEQQGGQDSGRGHIQELHLHQGGKGYHNKNLRGKRVGFRQQERNQGLGVKRISQDSNWDKKSQQGEWDRNKKTFPGST